ncbi:CapA family protein [Thermodesulfobacteriota bacterium]
MNKEKITLIALGDLMLGYKPETLFDHVVDVLRSGDITFANCDQVYSDKGHPNPTIFPSPSDPKNIPSLVDAGLDVISLANNHTLDWGNDALLDTMERISETNIKAVGVGKNITEARQPVILEKKGNRVGFLAYGCVGPEGYEAWEDKPGYAPVHSYTIYEKWDYQPGTPPRIITIADTDHLAAMEEDIRTLKSQVDVVAVSFHWGLHFQSAVIPMYGFQIGHAACDAGADIILGCHAHILKGIEVYKGKVIFHGQNNFAFRPFGPSGPPPSFRGHSNKPGKSFRDIYDKFDPEEALATLIGKVIIEEGQIKKVSYLPCYINKESEPEIVTRSDPKGEEVVSYIEKISRSQNLSTKFTWDGDEVVIEG